MMHSVTTRFCLGLVAIIVAAALLAMIWTPFDPLGIDIAHRLLPPSAEHWFGTDEFGRDVLSRLLSGAEASVMVAATTTLLALAAGVPLGLVAGYRRGWIDRVLMVFNDALLTFPGILLALGFVAMVGTGRISLINALALAYTPAVVRIARSKALSVSQLAYVEASRLMGNSDSWTLLRHVLPNCMGPLIVLATSMIGWVLLSESALSFLGLGVPPPAATWGNMLAASRPFFQAAPWLSIAPGLCIAASLLAINLLGDRLRDRFDPRSEITP